VRLAATLAAHGLAPLRLDARLPDGPGAPGSDPRRFLPALRPWARRVRSEAGEGAWPVRLIGDDLFREAHLHFKFYGRLMPVTCDRPPGIMHWTYPLPLRMVGWRNIYTIHDLIPIEQPELSSVRGERHARLLRAIIAKADRILTVTEAVRVALIDRFGCPPGLVVNSGQSVDLDLAIAASPSEPAPFLFCGSIEPRKNLERLVEGYRRSGTVRPLLIVGEDGWRASEVRARIGDVPGVTFLSFQGREALLTLMVRARALLFPSLAEGFGLPVAEAMTLGTPVMTSDRPALAEVAGGAALLVDPLDSDAIGAAIRALDRDDALVSRLREAGRVKAIDYAPPRYYERLQRIYADVAEYPRSAIEGA
jgi:glycosyltransferase involved in cell wall biosynthesis